MKILTFRGVEYPRCVKCQRCDTELELDYDDVKVTESHPKGWEYAVEYHNYTCPVCGYNDSFEGRKIDKTL